MLSILARSAANITADEAATAAIIAMTQNYLINNLFTYRDKRQHGRALLSGLARFYLICGAGALVSVVLAALAEGMNPAEVAEEYPPLTEEHVRAAIAYAAELTDEEDMTPLRSATLA